MAYNPSYWNANGRPAQSWYGQSSQPGPSSQPYGYPASVQPVNLSGGYNPYAGYAPQATWGAPSPSFGQTLFRGGSSAYSHPSANPDPSRPAKRPKGQDQEDTPSHSRGVSAWRNCSVPGCGFVGPGDQVEIHEGDRHLIFPNGHRVERSEEEEKFAKRRGPAPVIEGTTITLQTDEDIAKWIAERKAKWPSARRVAEKEEERRSAIERGELPARGRGRGGRDARGGRGGRRNDPASQAEDWGRPVTPLDGVSERGPRGRGRGRGRGTPRGRDAGYGARGGAHGGSDRIVQHETSPARAPSHEPGPQGDMSARVEAQNAVKNTIGGLAAYDSASDEDEDASDDSSSTTLSDSEPTTSSDESDEEVEPAKANDSSQLRTIPAIADKPLCKFFAKTGKCRHGDRCRFAHVREVNQQNRNQAERHRPVAKRQNPFDRPGMLSALLATPIQNTLSQISQTIRFLVANDMLENVELKPGDAEALARRHDLITEVSPKSETFALDVPEAGQADL
ncbi:nuclear fragile X mental retardation-interacting protein 1-domain-containing protein [Kockovaella imperatae]|uniref:Nuclear fragile X mental retardation-interacting protein 1-domain-containing protein n=1 Tax=Kockovaella imperatae TaxID=4999 RepID=A0A1Y1U7Z9_9TREE|nr:nuclear fragile X mental retardation-interacting protein 1-domain-containing protein [Kockovaella imperatae]ORX34159.1 nuclear fragile X mental retardation-interacting protein 1-domain-containing protein [Kockovaella imperatae]